MHEVNVKGILSAKNGMNIYRGCLHGCIYCDSRSLCYQMKHNLKILRLRLMQWNCWKMHSEERETSV